MRYLQGATAVADACHLGCSTGIDCLLSPPGWAACERAHGVQRKSASQEDRSGAGEIHISIEEVWRYLAAVETPKPVTVFREASTWLHHRLEQTVGKECLDEILFHYFQHNPMTLKRWEKRLMYPVPSRNIGTARSIPQFLYFCCILKRFGSQLKRWIWDKSFGTNFYEPMRPR